MKFPRIFLPVLLATFSGCISTKDCIDRCCVDCRNRCYAERAWLKCKSTYRDVDCKCDFGKGFRDGYVAVASGAGQCQPALPPREYWHFENQTPDGQARQLAWFNGYSYGALYADQEGIAEWGRVITSPTLPPYRKRRPTRSAAAAAPVENGVEPVQPEPEYDNGTAPYVEPAPIEQPPLAPSASADIDDLEGPQTGSRASSDSPVRWTEAGEGY